jgi:AraC-like DNA-binding protein
MSDFPTQLHQLDSACPAETTAVLNELHASVHLKVLRHPERFKASIASIGMDGSRYTLVSYGTEVALECHHDRPTESAIMCLKGTCRINVDGEVLQLAAGEGLVGRPRRGLRGDFSHDCRRLVIRTLHPDLDPEGRRMRVVAIGRDHLVALADLILATTGSSELLSCVRSDEAIGSAFRQLALALLEGSRAQDRPQAPDRVWRPRSIIRAENLVAGSASEPLTVADLAAAAGLSERALQIQFRRYRNCTPMEFLKQVRMRMARQLLSQADVHDTISAIALRCGFGHPSRFAADYRSRFGESPSATRERQGRH